jgi:hypothetical protein
MKVSGAQASRLQLRTDSRSVGRAVQTARVANSRRDSVPGPRERMPGGRPRKGVSGRRPRFVRRPSAPRALAPDGPRTSTHGVDGRGGGAEVVPPRGCEGENLEGERSPGRTAPSVTGIQSGASKARTRRRSKALKWPLNRSARHPATEAVSDRAPARRPEARRQQLRLRPVDLWGCVEVRRAIGGPEPICRRGPPVRSGCASSRVRPGGRRTAREATATVTWCG